MASRPCPVLRAWYFANRRAISGGQPPVDKMQMHLFDADLEALRYNRDGKRTLYKHAGTVAYRVRPGDPVVAALGDGTHPLGAYLTFEGGSAAGASGEAAAAGPGAMFWVTPKVKPHPVTGAPLLCADHYSFFPAPNGQGRALDVHLTAYQPQADDPATGLNQGVADHIRAPRLPVTFELPPTAEQLGAKLGRLAGSSDLVWRLMHRPFEDEPGTVPPVPLALQAVAAQAGGAGRRGGRGGEGRRRARRSAAQRGQRERSFNDLWVELPIKRLTVVVLPLPPPQARRGRPAAAQQAPAAPAVALTVFVADRIGRPPVARPFAAHREVPAAAVATREGLEAAVAGALATFTWEAFVYRDTAAPAH